jgi:hypothetical protein
VNWKIEAVERNVRNGVQDPRDLEDVKALGRVPRPEASICIELAREKAAEIDKSRRKR